MWALSDYEASASSDEEGSGSGRGRGREVQQNAQWWQDPQLGQPAPGQQLPVPLLQPQTQQRLQQLPQQRPGRQVPSTLDELLASLGWQAPQQQQQQPDVPAMQPYKFLLPAVLNQRQLQGQQQGQQQGQER